VRLVFLLRPPALRSIPYARQRTSCVGQSLVPTRLDLSPEIPQRRPTRGCHPPQNHESRANEPKIFLPFIPARTHRLPHRRVGATSRASRRRAGFRFPRDVSRIPTTPPRSTTTAPRASTSRNPEPRSSFASRLPRFVSFRYAPSCVCRRATQKDGWVAGKALCVRVRAVEIVSHQCKI